MIKDMWAVVRERDDVEVCYGERDLADDAARIRRNASLDNAAREGTKPARYMALPCKVIVNTDHGEEMCDKTLDMFEGKPNESAKK